jgi:hypothetical protein
LQAQLEGDVSRSGKHPSGENLYLSLNGPWQP